MYAIMDLLTALAKVEGEILLEGRDLLKMSKEQRRIFLGDRVSMIFQDSINALNPYEKIRTQMERTIHRHYQLKGSAAKEFARMHLEELGLEAERVLEAFPHQLSGGMRQRVFIALALCTEPKLIIADEPTTALDTISQMGFMELIKELSDKRKLPIIFISHNLALMARFCSRLIVMSEGKIIEEGTTFQILQNPVHPLTKELVFETARLYERKEI